VVWGVGFGAKVSLALTVVRNVGVNVQRHIRLKYRNSAIKAVPYASRVTAYGAKKLIVDSAKWSFCRSQTCLQHENTTNFTVLF
jgi:hypothetical protein